MKVNITCRAEITLVCIIGSLFEIDVSNSFGYDKVTVCISLAVRMGNHIDGHIVCAYTDISSMITIESTQKYLFCFPPALMLTYKKAGHDSKYLLGIADIA